MTPAHPDAPLDARLAIEALRAGVPNRAAIRQLGSVEPGIEAAFAKGLDGTAAAEPPQGLVFAGPFGSGKSHLLHVLREHALQRNMIVSWVTVSKETPLFQPGPVFAAAMRSAIVPGSPDEAVTTVLSRIQRRPGAVQELQLWLATAEGRLAPVFAAVAQVLARDLPPDLVHGIEAFLSGARPPTALVRRKLAQMGMRGMFDLTGTKAAELAAQLPRVMARMVALAGYAGWCVLFDEAELIGRYGANQRALAYAELARWLSLRPGAGIQGVHAACAITDDFASAVITARQDDEKLPERLRNKDMAESARLATEAMRAIQTATPLAPPREMHLERMAATLRTCYAAAYAWNAPMPEIMERRANRTMRHHVRGWVTEWDMLRLEGTFRGIETTPLAPNVSEDETFSAPPPAEQPDT